MSQNNFPDTLPGLERLVQRVKSADRSNAKEVKLTIQEARDAVTDIALFTTRLAAVVSELNANIAELKQNNNKIDIKFDGGNF